MVMCEGLPDVLCVVYGCLMLLHPALLFYSIILIVRDATLKYFQ